MSNSKIFDVQDRMLSLLTSDVFFNDPNRKPETGDPGFKSAESGYR